MDNNTEGGQDDGDFVRALARGLSVIESFDQAKRGLSLVEVAARTNLSRGTAARLLNTLVKLGYVRSDGRMFSLLPRALRLGYAYLSSQPLWQLAQPVLESISQETGSPTSLCVLDGRNIVFVFTSLLPDRGAMRYVNSVGVGMQLPAFCTAAGRVLLSDLSDEALSQFLDSSELTPRLPSTTVDPVALKRLVRKAKKDGYAIQDEEVEKGFRAIAVPVVDSMGNIAASISITTVIGGHSRTELATKLLPVLQRGATSLTGLLQGMRH
jgi:IclR family pca regulon transcriptional regulator